VVLFGFTARLGPRRPGTVAGAAAGAVLPAHASISRLRVVARRVGLQHALAFRCGSLSGSKTGLRVPFVGERRIWAEVVLDPLSAGRRNSRSSGPFPSTPDRFQRL